MISQLITFDQAPVGSSCLYDTLISQYRFPLMSIDTKVHMLWIVDVRSEAGRHLSRGPWGPGPCVGSPTLYRRTCNLSSLSIRHIYSCLHTITKQEKNHQINLSEGLLILTPVLSQKAQTKQETERKHGRSFASIVTSPHRTIQSLPMLTWTNQSMPLTQEMQQQLFNLKGHVLKCIKCQARYTTTAGLPTRGTIH